MKSTLFLASCLLGSLSAAAPLNKRSYIWKTITQEVFATVEITSTVWVDAATPAAVVPESTAVTTPGAFYEKPKSSSSAAPVYTPSNTPASSSAQPVVSTPAYTPPASPSTPAYTPPSSSSTPAYTPPAPSTTQAPAPVSTPAYTPSSTPSSTPPAATPTGGSGSGTKYYGDITYYNPAGGYGACGWTIADSDPVVALAWEMMGAQSNGNPWCGKKIAIVRNGKTYSATIGDKCAGCAGASIDLTQGLWEIAAPDVDGRGHNVEWYVVE